MKRFAIIVSLLVAVAVLGAWAAVLTTDHDPIEKRIGDLRPLAEGGDTGAQLTLATLLWSDGNGPADRRAAVKWFKTAAKQGNAEAQFRLGSMYEHGEGVAQDYVKAVDWYHRAARFGALAGAQFALGQMYFYGRGVPQDYGQAITWFRHAAERGNASAQVLMGDVYEEGWGVQRDLIEAYVWYTLAIRNSHRPPAARRKLDPVLARADLVRKMNSVQIGRAEKIANERRPKG